MMEQFISRRLQRAKSSSAADCIQRLDTLTNTATTSSSSSLPELPLSRQLRKCDADADACVDVDLKEATAYLDQLLKLSALSKSSVAKARKGGFATRKQWLSQREIDFELDAKIYDARAAIRNAEVCKVLSETPITPQLTNEQSDYLSFFTPISITIIKHPSSSRRLCQVSRCDTEMAQRACLRWDSCRKPLRLQRCIN